MSVIRFSEDESRISGYRIGRGSDLIETDALMKLLPEITAGGLDVIRLKLKSGDPEWIRKIEAGGMPWLLYTVNYRNREEIPSVARTLPEGVTFEEVRLKDKDRVLNILKGIFASRSWPEFTNDLYNAFFPEAIAWELFSEYFGSFNCDFHADRHAYILKKENMDAGIFMGQASKGVFFGTLYGILPEYRKAGLSKAIYAAMDGICHSLGLRFFENDIHILNFPSQRSATGSGLVPQSIFYNVILFPMLGNAGDQLIFECKAPDPLTAFQQSGAGSVAEFKSLNLGKSGRNVSDWQIFKGMPCANGNWYLAVNANNNHFGWFRCLAE